MRSPEFNSKVTLEKRLQETIQDNPDTNATHADKKALIRRECAQIAVELRFHPVQGKLISQYYLKLLDNDPKKASQFWQNLYGLYYYAKDPSKIEEFLTALIQVTSGTGLSYLWDLMSGIIRGDYEVLQANPTTFEKCYFLYYRPDAEEENTNTKRHESLRKLKGLMEGVIIEKPEVGYRAHDFAMLNEDESKMLKEVNKTISKQLDTLLYARVELEDIFEYIQWLKLELKRIITEASSNPRDDRTKAKFEVFLDSKVIPYLENLYTYASTMSEEVHDNQFVKDIMNEPFVIFNGTIDKDHNELSPIDRLKAEWHCFEMSLKESLQNPLKSSNDSLGETVFITATPVQGESIQKDDSKASVLVRKPALSSETMMGFLAIDPTPDACAEARNEIQSALGRVQLVIPAKEAQSPANIVNSDPVGDTGLNVAKVAMENAPTEIQIITAGTPEELNAIKLVEKETRDILGSLRLNSAQGVRDLDKQLKEVVLDRIVTPAIRKAFVSTVLFYVINLQGNSAYNGKERHLWIYLRNLFSRLESDQQPLPVNKTLNKLNDEMPKIESLDALTILAERLQISGSISNPLHEFRRIIEEEIGCLGFHIKTEQNARQNPFDQEAFEKLKSITYAKLDEFEDTKKRLTGGFGSRFVRRMKRSKKENEDVDTYLAMMAEFLKEFKEKALDPTFNNIEQLYYPSLPTPSQSSEQINKP